MANIKKNDNDKKAGRYMILPRDNKTYEEKYAICIIESIYVTVNL